MNVYQDILSTVGNTPLVRINRVVQKAGVEIYAKLEGTNPTGSVKDRIALGMIEAAIEKGQLRPGSTIIEATSGNTGIGLAMVGAIKGFPVEIVMSAGVSIERRQMLTAFDAKIILTDPALGTDGAIEEARRRVAANPEKYFVPDQFANPENRLTHYRTTAAEILRDTDNRVTHFVSAIGTTGTLMGVGKRLKEANKKIAIVAAEPVMGHRIQGLKNMREAIVPEIYDPAMVDTRFMIETEEAYAMARRLVSEEGIFTGMSSGAAMVAARELAKTLTQGVVVVILPDRGEKYLSTPLFQ